MKRHLSIDIIKLVAACGIVTAHTQFLTDIAPETQYILYNGALRFAVPLFLFINGFFFYSRLENGYVKPWFKHSLMLYVVWMLIYGIFWLRPDKYSILEILHTAFFGFSHLWYVPAMIVAGLITTLVFRLSLYKQLALIMIFFLIGVAIQYIGNYNLSSNPDINMLFNQEWVHRNGLLLGFPFFFMGYLMAKYKTYMRFDKLQSFVLLLIGIFIGVFEAAINYSQPDMQGSFDNSLALLVSCPAVFIFFINLSFEGKNKNLSSYATGIYFSHLLIVILLNHFFDLTPTRLTAMTLVLSIIATFVLVRINKRFPFFL